MGGQACVFYGAAQFSKDIDLALLAEEENYARLRAALDELDAPRIAVPPFDPAALERGHAVHFRCQRADVRGLRVDVMTRLRDLAPFPILWDRRTTITDEKGYQFDLLAVEDLVQAKKTQRMKDWPMIDALVENHFLANAATPTAERVAFWLCEARTPHRIIDLAQRFPAETHALLAARPLLEHALRADAEAMRPALDAEVRTEQEKDRAYWAPLKREMEEFRRLERL